MNRAGGRGRIAMKSFSPSGYRWCPRPIPNFSAFCLNEPSDRFINFASFDTGVLAFECVFNSLMSDAVYVLRIAFFFGVFFKRLNAHGAFWAMMVGFALGLFRMFVDSPVTLGLKGFQGGYAQGSFLWIVNNIYFQYFSVLITVASAVVMVTVSYMTAPQDYTTIQSLTFGTATQEDLRRTSAGWNWKEVASSGAVLLCILGAYLYFRG